MCRLNWEDPPSKLTQFIGRIHSHVTVELLWSLAGWWPEAPSGPKGSLSLLLFGLPILMLTSSKAAKEKPRANLLAGGTLIYGNIIMEVTAHHLCHMILLETSHRSHPNSKKEDKITIWSQGDRDCRGSLRIFHQICNESKQCRVIQHLSIW